MIKVYDYYDFKEFLGTAKSIKEAKKIAKQRYDETDGECEIYIVFKENNKIICKFLNVI